MWPEIYHNKLINDILSMQPPPPHIKLGHASTIVQFISTSLQKHATKTHISKQHQEIKKDMG